MVKKNALILGGSPANNGVYDILKKLGCFVFVADYRPNIKANYDKHILFDACSPELISILRTKNINIDFVYTSMDGAGLAQHAICKEYKLFHASEEAISNAHHKNLMHEAWLKAGLLNRESIALSSCDYAIIANMNKNKKIIIKPANACASRGLSVLETKSPKKYIQKAFEKAMAYTTNSLVNIEEFLEGTEFSVEMLGDNYGNVSVFSIGRRYYMQNSNVITACKIHYNSKDLDIKTREKIAQKSIECYKALNLKNTLGHFEVMLKKDGTLSPIELGARSSGFIGSHCAELTTNKSLIKEYYKVLHGKKIETSLLPQNNISSLYFIYDLPPNIPLKKEISLVNFLDEKIICHAYNREYMTLNKKFKVLEQDTDRYGYEIVSGSKEILTMEHIQKAEENFLKECFYE